MTEYEKLKKLIDEADRLIASGCTSEDTSFSVWQDEAELFINRKFGKESLEYQKFRNITFDETDYSLINGYGPSIDQVALCKKGLSIAKGMLQSFLDDLPEQTDENPSVSQLSRINSDKVFIVHGHDGELKESVARILERQGIKTLILSEQTNQGRTIIEKFEDYSDVGGAICLFTADDLGKAEDDPTYHLRARQNVIFETGFFMGQLGRDRVVIISDKEIEIPSDLLGVVYTSSTNWKIEVLKELQAIGYTIDLNKLL